jgi:hypothetical protein
VKYSVRIVLPETDGPESERIPSYSLPSEYGSPRDATDAARAEIKRLDLAPGAAWFYIVDAKGQTLGA